MRKGTIVLLAALAAACTASPPGDVTPSRSGAPSPDTIAFLFDGSTGDADLVSGPALAGLELAAQHAGGIDIQPVNVGVDADDALAALRELGDDRGVAAAVVGPWTAPPDDAVEALAGAGVPVVSLSWAWGPPMEHPRLWLSLAAGKSLEANALLRVVPEFARRSHACAAGDRSVMSRALLESVERVSRSAGGVRVHEVGTVDPERPATAAAVAGRLSRNGCGTLLWTGGAETAAILLGLVAEGPQLVATSRMKTVDGLALIAGGVAISTVCVCADVTLSPEPDLQRFVHDFQADSGSAPGPFAVEAYDAGRLLVEQLRLGERTRGGLVGRLAGLQSFPGLVGPYLRGPGSAPTFLQAPPGVWLAAGSRWLPHEAVSS